MALDDLLGVDTRKTGEEGDAHRRQDARRRVLALGRVGLLVDPDATLEDFREAVETLEETARIARRVLGASHPMSAAIEDQLQQSRAALRVREGSA